MLRLIWVEKFMFKKSCLLQLRSAATWQRLYAGSPALFLNVAQYWHPRSVWAGCDINKKKMSDDQPNETCLTEVINSPSLIQIKPASSCWLCCPANNSLSGESVASNVKPTKSLLNQVNTNFRQPQLTVLVLGLNLRWIVKDLHLTQTLTFKKENSQVLKKVSSVKEPDIFL